MTISGKSLNDLLEEQGLGRTLDEDQLYMVTPEGTIIPYKEYLSKYFSE